MKTPRDYGILGMLPRIMRSRQLMGIDPFVPGFGTVRLMPDFIAILTDSQSAELLSINNEINSTFFDFFEFESLLGVFWKAVGVALTR